MIKKIKINILCIRLKFSIGILFNEELVVVEEIILNSLELKLVTKLLLLSLRWVDNSLNEIISKKK